MDERPSQPSLLSSLTTGFGAGIGATVIMSVLMVSAGKLGLMGQQPPSKLSDRLLDRFSPFRSSQKADALGTAIHYAIGAGLGAGFALLRRLVPPFRLPGAGVAYALAVWATSYGGLLPALKVMPPPNRDRLGRPQTMIAAHVLFGLVLGLLTRGTGRGRRSETEAVTE